MKIITDVSKFKDNTFNWHDWSAPIIQDPRELRKELDKMNLIGRKIKSMKFVGRCYNLNRRNIEDRVLDALEGKGIDISKYDTGMGYHITGDFSDIDPKLSIKIYGTEIDEPFIIEFEDGNHLDIDYSDFSTVRVAMNSMPIDIKHSINRNNFDANVLFSELIGKTIVDVMIEDCKNEDGSFTFSYGMNLDKQNSYINKITLVIYEVGNYCLNKYELSFRPSYDYGDVYCFCNGIPFEKTLEDMLKGIINEG